MMVFRPTLVQGGVAVLALYTHTDCKSPKAYTGGRDADALARGRRAFFSLAFNWNLQPNLPRFRASLFFRTSLNACVRVK